MATFSNTDNGHIYSDASQADIVQVRPLRFSGLAPVPTPQDVYTGTPGNDTWIGTDGDDTAKGGDGNDFLIGGKGNDRLEGEEGGDDLVGQEGNDILFGGNGNDSLSGDAGADQLYGGAGNDYLYIRAGDLSPGDLFDGGADFDELVMTSFINISALNLVSIEALHGTDVILTLAQLDAAQQLQGSFRPTTGGSIGFNGVTIYGSTGFTFSEQITFDLTGAIISNPISTWTYGAEIFASYAPDTITGSNMDDFIHGYGSNDVINGGDGNDEIYGDDGNDLVNGGNGNDVIYANGNIDTLNGDAGDDLFVVAAIGNTSTINGGTGTDALSVRITGTPDLSSLNWSNLERIESYWGAAIKMRGDQFAGVTYIAAPSITLTTGGTITLGITELTTTLFILSGEYTVFDYSKVTQYNPTGFEVVGTGAQEAIMGSQYHDLIRGFGGNDQLYGNDGNDSLIGGDGNDELFGGKGDDILEGEDGDDFFEGGAGDDQLRGGPGSNSASYSNASGAVIVNLTTGTASGADGNDTLSFINHVLGSAFGDTLTGDSGSNRLSGYEGNDTLRGMDGNDSLAGGAGADTMIGGTGDDLYDVDDLSDVVTEAANEGFDTVHTALAALTLADNAEALIYTGIGSFAGTGNAISNAIDSTAGTGNDVLRGMGGHDVLASGAGNDTLYGDEGNDWLQGGTGADIMYGGTGDDIYDVDDAGDQLNEIDGEGTDTARVKLNSYTLGAALENLTFLGTGDFTGSGNGLANLIEGGGGNDTLRGFGGNDTLNGGYGNDLLYGGTGSDITVGGMGDDIHFVDDSTDTAVEFAGEGNDLVMASVSYMLAAGQEIEALDASDPLSTAAIDLTGNEFGQEIAGNNGANTLMGLGGNDRLLGGGGNDRLDGGTGLDAMYGGSGDDVYVVENAGDTVFEVAGQGSDTVLTDVDFVLVDGQEVETLKARVAIDVIPLSLTGNSLANRIEGNAGNNILNGLGGADVLVGGAGNDVYVVTDLLDTIIEDSGAGLDQVELILPNGGVFTLAANVERIAVHSESTEAHGNTTDNLITSYATSATLYGEGGDDILIGGSGIDNLFGGDGADTLNGGGGADNLYGGAGNDVYGIDNAGDLTFEDANGGSDTVYSSVSHYLYANVEGLVLTGSADLFGVGNELANTLDGNTGSNLLIAGAGDDVVHGGGGVDSLFGQDGADQLFGDAGVDYLVGGTGNDILDGGLDADALYGEDGDDTLIGGADFKTDILVGGDGNDTLRGNSGLADYDLMDGGAGNDAYYVDTGDDLTFEAVGGGTDTVYANVAGANSGVYLYANVENLVLQGTTTFGVGNALANTLTGNASGNLLLGGDGNDILNGKGGNDVLFGEAGADRFVFEAGTGGDVIGDFAVGTDKIDLTAFGLSWQTVLNSMHENAGTTAIDLGNGNFIVLNGVAANTLGQGDFILTGGTGAVSGSPARIFDDALATYDTGFQHGGFLDVADTVLQGGPAMGLFDWHQPDAQFHIL